MVVLVGRQAVQLNLQIPLFMPVTTLEYRPPQPAGRKEKDLPVVDGNIEKRLAQLNIVDVC